MAEMEIRDRFRQRRRGRDRRRARGRGRLFGLRPEFALGLCVECE